LNPGKIARAVFLAANGGVEIELRGNRTQSVDCIRAELTKAKAIFIDSIVSELACLLK
jgi:hypothetical protein